MTIAAAVFDAFGTLVEIQRPTHPFRKLIQEGRRQGRKPQPDDLRVIMTHQLSLAEAASAFGISVTADSLGRLEQSLEDELASIRPFPSALHAVGMLQAAGVRVGVCSNLASAYGPVIRQIFPYLHGYGFSYEVGAMKPEPAIYRATCEQLGVNLGCDETEGRVFMVGDSASCDRDGPRQLGGCGFLLHRGGKGDFSNLLEFAQAVLERE
ncbi:haloacid dehalogenase-like hydrolase [compost metagenome]